MPEKTTIKIFFASAGELAEERKKSVLVLTQLNKSHKHLHIEPVLWELDMVKGNYPDKKSIQDAINPKLQECQVIVFMFYTRLGENTLIEFDLAKNEQKKMLVLFKEGFSPKKDQLQSYGELLDFKESLNSILRMSYNDLDQFENLLYTNLNLYLSDTYPAAQPMVAGDTITLPSSIQNVIQDLIQKDKKIKELEDQLALEPGNKKDKALQDLIAEKELLRKKLQESEEIIQQQAKDKEDLEKKLILQKDIDAFKAKALKAVGERDYEAAEMYLKESAKSSFSDAAATLSELAQVKKLQLQYAEALKYFEMAIRLSPENSLYLNDAGIMSFDLGNYARGVDYYEKALAIDRKNYQEDHPYIATRYNNIGLAFSYLGNYDQAIEYYMKALTIYAKTLGEEDPPMATTYNNLGLAYNNKGEYDKGIEFYEKSLAILRKNFGEEHVDIARDYNNLGYAYNNKGEYQKAIDYYEKSLAIAIKLVGNEHPEVATRYNNIGLAFHNLGDFDKAIDYYEKALNIHKKIFGEEHPSIATTYNNLGLANHNKGDFDKAIDYYEKAMAIDKKFLGETHPDIALRYNNLGAVYSDKGEYDKAIEWYEKSLAIYRKIFGEEHPDIARGYNNLGMAYLNKGAYAKAFELIDKALAMAKKFLPADHQYIRTYGANLELARAGLALLEKNKNNRRKN